MKSGRYENILIMSDIDGTFLDNDSRAVEANIEAVKRFTSEGGRFAFASGRLESGLDELICGWRGLMNTPGIFCNGAYVYDAANDKILHECALDAAYTLPLLKDLKSKFPELVIRYTGNYGITFIDGSIDEKLSSRGGTEVWHKVVLFGEHGLLDEARSYIWSRCGDYFAYSKSCDTFLELLDRRATKGTMLEWLRGYLGGGIKIYTVGDYENDLDMLKHADVPVCPSNSLETVRDYCRANGLVVCDNNSGAVCELIKIMTGGAGSEI